MTSPLEEGRRVAPRCGERGPTARVGLASSGAVAERRNAFAKILRDDPKPPSQTNPGPLRERDGSAWMGCAEPGCRVLPIGSGGQVVKVKAKRWWCPEHRAGHEGDLEAWVPPRIYATAGGGFRAELSDEDREYYAELDRKRQEEHERKKREGEAENAAIEAAGERWEREYIDRAPPIAGFKQSQVKR